MLDNLSVSGTCLNITAEKVTLNGNGNWILGDGTGYGINATNPSGPGRNMTIYNLTISNFAVDFAGFGAQDSCGLGEGYPWSFLKVYNSNKKRVWIYTVLLDFR